MMQVHIDSPPRPIIAPMDMIISVGFGEAYVTKDGEEIYNEMNVPVTSDDYWTVQDAEDYASKEPNHVYKIIMYAPLHGETYQRNNKGEWVLINTNRGFA